MRRRLLNRQISFEICTVGHAKVIAGLTAMARLAGHDLVRRATKTEKVWAVVAIPSRDLPQGQNPDR